jgi:hypothetical protein
MEWSFRDLSLIERGQVQSSRPCMSTFNATYTYTYVQTLTLYSEVRNPLDAGTDRGDGPAGGIRMLGERRVPDGKVRGAQGYDLASASIVYTVAYVLIHGYAYSSPVGP